MAVGGPVGVGPPDPGVEVAIWRQVRRDQRAGARRSVGTGSDASPVDLVSGRGEDAVKLADESAVVVDLAGSL
jgi:hypothetical protein